MATAMTVTTAMATAVRTGPHRRDTLTTVLLIAVGRALAFVLLVVVVATAARGPLPGLSPASVSEDHAVVVEPPGQRPGQAQNVSWRDMNASRSAGDIASPRASVSK